ncbi:MAG: enoyl-CoA hydratase/isomerase family protein [Bacteroidales bacterium]|jgi:enoyl-CoA hydratase
MIESINTINFSLADGIGHIELNQPPANQMTSEFFTEFNELVDYLRILKGLNALVISGRGRHFSSGANLEELLGFSLRNERKYNKSIDEEWEAISERNYHSFLFLEQAEIPIVAAIRGVCLGSAFELALFCHFRFCGEDSVFGLPESSYNLIPGLGGIRKTALLCGQAKAIELILKGKTFAAEEALSYHLVDRIVSKRKVVEFSIAFAREIVKNYRKQKRLFYLQQIRSDDILSN